VPCHCRLRAILGLLIFAERRIAGRMMSRIGRTVWPARALQFVRRRQLIFKENIIPELADRKLYILAPPHDQWRIRGFRGAAIFRHASLALT